jgi:hypothetical protein|tara:strand:+ start:273 stop:494 length:222 start_codon:yes stop_codon:yes gene_type:complete
MKITNRAQAWAIASGFDAVLLTHPEIYTEAKRLTRRLYKSGWLDGYPFDTAGTAMTSEWTEDLRRLIDEPVTA